MYSGSVIVVSGGKEETRDGRLGTPEPTFTYSRSERRKGTQMSPSTDSTTRCETRTTVGTRPPTTGSPTSGGSGLLGSTPSRTKERRTPTPPTLRTQITDTNRPLRRIFSRGGNFSSFVTCHGELYFANSNSRENVYMFSHRGGL